MGIRKLLLEFIVILTAITCFVVILNSFQIYHSASEHFARLQEQYFDDTSEIYKDKIIGNLLVSDQQSEIALLQEISAKRKVGIDLSYEDLDLQVGTFTPRTLHKNYPLDFGDGRIAKLTLYSPNALKTLQFLKDLSFPLLLEMLVLGLGFIYLLWRVRKKLLAPLADLVSHLTPEQLEIYIPQTEAVLELKELSETLKAMNTAAQKKAIYEAEINTARQVVHDIRSPLTALESIAQNLPEVSEDKRVVIKNAVDTLKDLANNVLLAARRKGQSFESEQSEPIAILLERMVSEKRVQLANKIVLSLDIDKGAYGLFAKIDNTGFKRVISNLLNNAVDAINSRLLSSEVGLYRGEIKLILSYQRCSLQNGIKIILQDNGCGIAEENIEKVLQGGVSIGKEGGTGIGLSSSKQLIEAYGGVLEIKSKIGVGTEIALDLLTALPAAWCAQKLVISQDSEVLILDDDQTIHDVWARHFDEIVTPVDNIQLKHFYDPKEMMVYYANHQPKQFICLVDYELMNSNMTGLNVIEQLKLQNNAILVTSRYEDIQLREKSVKLGVKILPKNFTPYVFIEIIPANPDIILIDDYDSIGVAWKMYGAKKGKRVAAFTCISDFERYLSLFKKDTPIYIDSFLRNDEIHGEEYAKKLYDQGYKDLYLETGRDLSEDALKKWPWFKGIVDKSPPF